MFTVYVLYSAEYDKIYIGQTSDMEERLLSHNEKATKGWTIHFRPWALVHTEHFSSREEARAREKQLKSSAGRRWIRQTILKQ